MGIRVSKKWMMALGIVAGVIALVYAGSYILNSEKMRRYAEQKMNRELRDYTVHIGRAHFNPIAFSLLLQDVILTQNANPTPPVANIKGMKASLHWSELLRGHVVAEFRIDNPKVFMNLAHFRNEERSPVPLKKKGWQEAVQAIYPIKINHFRISGGDFTYVDPGPYKPLHATNIDLVASNIRNIESPNNVFPSAVHLRANIFDKGALTLDGRADFLAQPHMAFKGSVDLKDMELSYFEPILARNNLSVRSGTASTSGTIEYTPKLTAINVDDVNIDNVVADYVHLPQTAGKEKQRVRQTANNASRYSNEPSAQLRIKALNISNSTLAYVDKTSDPGYRIFFSDLSGRLGGFTNQLSEGPSKLDLHAKFMGSGATTLNATFRPETKKTDVAVRLAIDNTQMQAMKDIFRAKANFDVKSGLFSFYSDMRIQNDQINGWVKPIFKDIKIGDREDKKSKNPMHKVYMGTVKALAKVLENQSKKQVATKTDISGPIESPNVSIMQIVTNLVENAWIRAILPGFQSEAGKE